MTEYFMPISELAKKLDLPAHTLRYWEKEFPQIIKPITGAGGRRFYRNETVDNFMALKKYLYADGFTIDGVKKLIANGDFSASNREPEVISNDLKNAINLLHEAKQILSGK